MRPSVTKDMSLVSLVSQWTGTDKGALLNQFFEAIDIAALIGCWSEADMVQLAILRLSNIARAFYDGTRELHDRNITWANFKAIFQKRFSRCEDRPVSLHTAPNSKTGKGRDPARIRGVMQKFSPTHSAACWRSSVTEVILRTGGVRVASQFYGRVKRDPLAFKFVILCPKLCGKPSKLQLR